jgi:hypothetical protein
MIKNQPKNGNLIQRRQIYYATKGTALMKNLLIFKMTSFVGFVGWAMRNYIVVNKKTSALRSFAWLVSTYQKKNNNTSTVLRNIN